MPPLRISTMPRRALVQLEAPTRDGGPNVSRYLVQYRVAGQGEWKTYSRHNKIERAQDARAKVRRFYLDIHLDCPTTVTEVEAA